MEVKLIGCSAINWFCPTNSKLQNIAGPGTACQDKGNARGKKGPVIRVFTGVLFYSGREQPHLKQSFWFIFGNPNPNPFPKPNPNHSNLDHVWRAYN